MGISAGTSVIESIATPSMAKLLVKASGWNVLPSWPVRANTGMNEIRMIITEKKIGRPTVRQAGMTISRVSPVTLRSPKCAVRWCVAFSTITIAWSTRMPIEMAMPESDMMFEAIAEQPHQDERDQHRQRQRQADHQRAAEVHRGSAGSPPRR